MRTERPRDPWQTTLVLALAASALVVGVWYPTDRRQRQAEEQLMAAQRELSQQTIQTGSPMQLQQQIRQAKQQLGHRGSQVPRQDDVPALLRTLSQLAENHGIGQAQITNRAVLAGDQYQAAPMVIQFKAPFPQAFAMLKEIESMPRLLRVTKLDIARESSGAQASDVQVNVNLELAAFFAPLPSSTAKTPQP